MDVGLLALLGLGALALVMILFTVLNNPYEIAEEEYDEAQKKRGRWWRLDNLLSKTLKKRNPWDTE